MPRLNLLFATESVEFNFLAYIAFQLFGGDSYLLHGVAVAHGDGAVV